VVCQRRIGDRDYSEGDVYLDVESDGQLDTTVATVVTTKNLTEERDGDNWRYLDYEHDDSNRCYFDVVGSTRHQGGIFF